jgi:putative aminopeptidase FrvX
VKTVYIATGLARKDDALALAEVLKGIGFEITYEWWKHGSVQEEGPARIAEVSAMELDGVRRADLFIALLPGGRGTHTEFGYALASQDRRMYAHPSTRIMLVGPLEENGITCAFYLHPLVDERFKSVSELLAWLKGWKVRQA